MEYLDCAGNCHHYNPLEAYYWTAADDAGVEAVAGAETAVCVVSGCGVVGGTVTGSAASGIGIVVM